MNYQTELKFATDLAHDAGKIMLRYFRSDDLGTVWKEDVTPLTLADTTINDMVIEKVKKAFPEHGILGEEASYRTERTLLWVCDPVDGTMPFSIGLPISTFAIALVEDGKPMLGVVYDPFSDRLFTAIKGQGAFMNGQPIHVSDRGLENGAFVDLAMRHNAPGGVRGVGDFRGAISETGANPFSIFSYIMAAMLVASGDFVAAYFGFKKPVDLAAVKVIVEEAGGRVTDIDGQDQRYDGPINGGLATNGVVHDQFIEIIRSARK